MFRKGAARKLTPAPAMNAFMSLISTFLLDLTPWAVFIKTPSVDMLNSVITVSHILSPS